MVAYQLSFMMHDAYAEGLHVERPMGPLQVMRVDKVEGAMVVVDLLLELGQDAGVIEE